MKITLNKIELDVVCPICSSHEIERNDFIDDTNKAVIHIGFVCEDCGRIKVGFTLEDAYNKFKKI